LGELWLGADSSARTFYPRKMGSARYRPSAEKESGMSGAVAVKRFYERVGVRCAAKAEYLVTLDGRDLRTPAKKLLSVPTEGLAWAIASEWEAQPKQRIQPSLMPLMTLATTTIDQFPDIRANMTRSMLRAMESDVACLLSSDQPVRHPGLEPRTSRAEPRQVCSSHA
jgi:chaperone required for assembly of F1-ATPase